MRDNKDFVVGRLRFLDDLISVTQKRLKQAPPGRLLVRNRKGKPHYYHLNKDAPRYDTYLKESDEHIIRALAQKEYDTQVIDAAVKEREALFSYVLGLGLTPEAVYSACNSVSNARTGMLPENVYLQIPDSVRMFVTPPPMLAPDDLYVNGWLSFKYNGLPIKDNEKAYQTENGEIVRSKSELIIANTLYSFGVPYRYECPLYLGKSVTVYPDFTPLNVRLRKEYYWEHLGLLSD